MSQFIKNAIIRNRKDIVTYAGEVYKAGQLFKVTCESDWGGTIIAHSLWFRHDLAKHHQHPKHIRLDPKSNLMGNFEVVTGLV